MDNTEILLQQTITHLQQMNVQLQQRLDDIDLQLAELRQRNSPQPLNNRITTQEASELLGVHRLTLAQYRKHWIKGVHYFPQAKEYLYNRELLDDWQQNRSNPEIHQRAIDLWLSRQASNQPKRGKKAS